MNPNIQQQSDTAALILGALTAGGGITGYVRTGSVPSIAAGVTVGSLVCPHSTAPPLTLLPFHIHLILQTSNYMSKYLTIFQYILGGLRIRSRAQYGVELALLASIILAGSSIPRALKTQKPLPAGLSVLALYGLWAFGTAFQRGTARV